VAAGEGKGGEGMSDEHINIFSNITETEQIELSDLLDKFLQLYENDFFDVVDDDDDREQLMDEFKHLYNMVDMLQDRS
jgi:hypothetical protein